MRLSDRWQEALGLLLFFAVAWLGQVWLNDLLRIAAVAALSLSLSWMLGHRLFAPQWSRVEQGIGGVLTWMASTSLLMVAAYYLSIPLRFGTTIVMQGLLAIGALTLPVPASNAVETIPQTPPRKWLTIALLALGWAAIALLARSATLHQTFISIRTPWPLLPEGSFLLFAVPFAAGMIAAIARKPVIAACLTITSWLSLAMLPNLLYPLGYGFDGFIHRASEQVLSSTGLLQPKPLYYLGQYVWVVWLEQQLRIPLAWADSWLVPASLLIVGFALAGLMKRLDTRARFLPLFLLLFLPLSSFVTTTPQSFAYSLGWSALLLSLWPELSRRAWALPLLLAAWAVASHPLGGLPFAIIVGAQWLATFTSSVWLRRVWWSLGLAGAVSAIPLAFWAQSKLGNTPIAWNWSWVKDLSWHELVPTLFFQPRQTLAVWIDGTEWSALLLHCVLIGLGLWSVLRPRIQSDRWLALTGLGLLMTQLLLERAATFRFLISYERGNYTERLGVLSVLFLSFPVARWLSERYAMLAARSGLLAGSCVMLLIGVWTTRVYDGLPRHDAAQASSGWSVGQADFEAVRWIHERAKREPYAVLANQTVSAAALQTYGFARYHNDTFYYPLPTGGELYQVFLEAATVQASTSTIQAAATLTSSTRVYVVINDYWWEAERVREHLATFAHTALPFQNGRVWVYEFLIPNSEKSISH